MDLIYAGRNIIQIFTKAGLMGFQSKLTQLCNHLGENNKPTYAVMAIAAVKGVCRPTFTMMDKTEKPETKKYTALREGLTELIAIPAYWACGEITSCFSKILTKKVTKEDFLPKKVLEQIKEGINNDQIEKALRHAEKKLVDINKRAENNLRFVGVCAAALVVIPALCSASIKPLMGKLIKPKSDENTPTAQPLKIQPAASHNITKKPLQFRNYNSAPQAGLRVGGL